MTLHWLTEREIGYVAGMMDGEGSIGLSHIKSKNMICYKPFVKITSTNRKVLEYIQDRLIMGAISISSHSKNNNRIGYEIQFRKHEMVDLLPKIVDSLIIKKRQAEIIMQFMELSNFMPNRGRPFKDSKRQDKAINDYLQKELLYKEIKELNRIGIT